MISKGDRYVAYPAFRPSARLYIEVTRVAKDGTWADIRVQTWAVMWTKRQKLNADGHPPESLRYEWDSDDLAAQEEDHMAMLREQGVLS